MSDDLLRVGETVQDTFHYSGFCARTFVNARTGLVSVFHIPERNVAGS